MNHILLAGLATLSSSLTLVVNKILTIRFYRHVYDTGGTEALREVGKIKPIHSTFGFSNPFALRGRHRRVSK